MLILMFIASTCISVAEAAKLKSTKTFQDDGWVKCADENGKCNIPDGEHKIRFGKNSTWREKIGSGPVDCDNNNFGDPLVGTVKECWYKNDRERELRGIEGENWIHCSDENGTCNLPSLAWVRYGKDSTWLYALADASVPCNNSQWGDPKFGTVKECQYHFGRGRRNGGKFALGNKISFNSVNYPDRFLRHRNFEVWLDPQDSSDLYQKDSTFIVRAANNGKERYVSFESVNYPGRFIRHSSFLLWLQPSDGSDLFKNDSSFKIEAARDGNNDHNTMESSNYPNYFIRHSWFRGRIDPVDTGNLDLYNHDSSWNIVVGNAK